MATAFPLSWQPKIKKLGFNFIENSIVKITGLYILPFNKNTLVKKTGDFENCLPYTPSPTHCPDIDWIFIYVPIQNATDACF